MDKVLLVNQDDKVIGSKSRQECHQGEGLLHRAFSIYILNNQGEILVQKRSKNKDLWPLMWTSSCCGHPRPGETYIQAGERRLKEELDFSVPLVKFDSFKYKAKYENKGSENGICAVLFGKYSGEIKKNDEEVVEYKWVKPEDLLKDLKTNPESYVPWFGLGLKKFLKNLEAKKKQKKELYTSLEQIAQKVDTVIEEVLKIHTEKNFHPLVEHQIKTGGKRLRPVLVFFSGRLLGAKEKDLLYPSAGIEILHNSSLIVDDIIDHSLVRRGKPTVWSKFGKSMAECIGLSYSSSAYLAANRSSHPREISEVYSKALKTVIDGEIYDILFEQRGREDESYVKKNRYKKVTLQSYYKMIGKKTAELLKACCEIGGICAQADKKQIEALKKYGYNLGMAFQIQDDILDILGDEKKFGKKIGKDIEERKLGNIMIFYALKELSSSQENKILNILKKKKVFDSDIKEAIRLIKDTDSFRKSFLLAEKFTQQAKQELQKLPQNKWNKQLQALADFTIERSK